jgi:hypothetical protein
VTSGGLEPFVDVGSMKPAIGDEAVERVSAAVELIVASPFAGDGSGPGWWSPSLVSH